MNIFNKAKQILSLGKRGFGTGIILSLITGVIFLVIFLGMASSLVPTAATSYHNFSDTMAAQGAVVGTAPAAFAGNTDDYLGWLWVAMPFLLILSLIVGLFRNR